MASVLDPRGEFRGHHIFLKFDWMLTMARVRSRSGHQADAASRACAVGTWRFVAADRQFTSHRVAQIDGVRG